MQRVPALDGVRGLAALGVVLAHTTDRFYPLGGFGVDVFFALSGFLVGGIILDTMDTPGWMTKFYLRRTARIWPLYFAVCGAACLVHPVEHAWLIPAFAINWNPVWPMAPIDTWPAAVYWSVGIEEWFYIGAPLFLSRCERRFIPHAVAAVALCSMILRYITNAYDPGMADRITPCRLEGLAMGVLAAWIFRNRRDWLPAVTPWALFLFGAALGTLRVFQWEVHSLAAAFIWQPLVPVGTSALLLALASGSLPRVARVLSMRPLAYLGTISYGVYSMHLFPRIALQRLGIERGPVLCAGVLCATIAAASISWRWFERPILARVRPH